MATKVEVQADIAKKLRSEVEAELSGTYVRDSISAQITINDWNSIATWMQARDFAAIGKHLSLMVRNTIVSDADAEAAVILQDNVVDLEEYARIEGMP
jgi:hypothetical protein